MAGAYLEGNDCFLALVPLTISKTPNRNEQSQLGLLTLKFIRSNLVTWVNECDNKQPKQQMYDRERKEAKEMRSSSFSFSARFALKMKRSMKNETTSTCSSQYPVISILPDMSEREDPITNAIAHGQSYCFADMIDRTRIAGQEVQN